MIASAAQKQRAKQSVANALRRGELTRAPACEKCSRIGGLTPAGAQIIQGHHPDYANPLSVEWLCIQCHRDVTPKPDFKGVRKYGADCYNTHFSDEQVRDIYLSTLSQYKLAALYGVHRATIGRIKRRQQWRHVTDALAECPNV